MSSKDNDVRALRKTLILDQREFAGLMDVDVGTVSRWERNLQKPKAVHLRKMARLKKKNGG